MSNVHEVGTHTRPRWIDDMLRFWPIIAALFGGLVVWAQAYAKIEEHETKIEVLDTRSIQRQTDIAAINATLREQTRQLERMDGKLDRLIEREK